MTDTIETRVARGVALLDEEEPGWDQRIDLDKLDLASPCRCVLGQTWDGDFESGVDSPFDLHSARLFGHLKIDQYYEETEYGFNAFDGSAREMEDQYSALTAEWRRVIEARRSAS